MPAKDESAFVGRGIGRTLYLNPTQALFSLQCSILSPLSSVLLFPPSLSSSLLCSPSPSSSHFPFLSLPGCPWIHHPTPQLSRVSRVLRLEICALTRPWSSYTQSKRTNLPSYPFLSLHLSFLCFCFLMVMGIELIPSHCLANRSVPHLATSQDGITHRMFTALCNQESPWLQACLSQ